LTVIQKNKKVDRFFGTQYIHWPNIHNICTYIQLAYKCTVKSWLQHRHGPVSTCSAFCKWISNKSNYCI